MLLQRVQEAQRIAIRELKDQDFDGKTVDSAAALEAEVGGGRGGALLWHVLLCCDVQRLWVRDACNRMQRAPA